MGDAAKVGDHLGSYVLEAELGQGSMGQVFRARHTGIGRQVAIKVLRPEHAANADLVQRFFHEAQVVNQINHDNIVQVLDFVNEPASQGGRVYCILELLSGESLTAALARRSMKLAQLLQVMEQVGSALGAAHALGIVHRDIKPDNIFIVQKPGKSPLAKVLDFGVAKLVGNAASVSTTHAGAVVGTPMYMSPEQAASLELDHRSDIYAFGTVLYEALSGAPPFTSQAFGQLVAQIITAPPKSLPGETPLGEAIPPAVRDVVMRCLEKQPEARPQTIAEVTPALRGGPAPAESAAASKPRRSRAAFVAGGLVLVAGAAWLMMHRTRVAPAVRAKPPPVAAALPAPKPVVKAPLPAPAPPAKPAPVAKVRVTIASEPAGALVTDAVTGESWGVTPVDREIAKGTHLELRLTRRGFARAEQALQADADEHVQVKLVPIRPRSAPAKPKPAKAINPDGLVDPFGQ